MLVGVRHDQAGIDRKPFAADQPCRNARVSVPFIGDHDSIFYP
jgi:hypothetical protein